MIWLLCCAEDDDDEEEKVLEEVKAVADVDGLDGMGGGGGFYIMDRMHDMDRMYLHFCLF